MKKIDHNRNFLGLAVWVSLFWTMAVQNSQAQCTLSISGTKTICNGQSSVWTANATGGTGYTYLWNTGATTQSITVNEPGTYSVTASGTLNISNGPNILPNGSFSAGNTAFNSDYYLSSSGGLGSFFISNNAISNYTWIGTNCLDHSTSADNYQMLLDGNATTTDRIWFATVPVDPNTTYNLSAWGQTLGSDGTAGSVATLQFAMNGTLIGSSLQLPTTTCNWSNLTTTWNSGSATSVTIAIRKVNTATNINDFAIDDISMVAVTTICQLTASDDLNVTAFTVPNAGLDKNQCDNKIFTMTANTIPTGLGTWTVVSGTATITNANSPNAIVDITGNTATLRWTSVNGSCSGFDDVVLSNSNSGAPPIFCNCGPIVANVETSAGNPNSVKPLNITTGLFGAQMGTLLPDYTAASAWDSKYGRHYFVGYTNRIIYYMNGTGTVVSTGVTMTSNTYNRAAYNPVDEKVYITNSQGTYWATYSPTAGGTGGTVTQLTPLAYFPSTAPVIGSGSNVGGDIVFDSKGKGYLITNTGNFYSFVKTAAGGVDITFLGTISNTLSQCASLAFSNDGRLFMGGVGTNVYVIDLQTLSSTVVNSSPSTNNADMSSCNYPVFEPILDISKTWRKTGGAPGPAVMTGDTIEYRVFIQNTGNISAGNTKFSDQIPAGTYYLPGTTKLNGTAVTDLLFLFMPFSQAAGSLINSNDQAFKSGAFSPVKYSATITFKVVVFATSGTISNTGKTIYGDNNQQVFSNTVSFEVCKPTATIVGPTNFCAGSSTTITAIEDGTWLWSNAATTQSITVNAPGTYSVTVTTPPIGPGPNIITNPYFDAGNSGFSSDYSFTAGTGTTSNYGIGVNAATFNPAYTGFYDHSSGQGQMMLVNGSSTPNARVWYQTVAVNPNTTYDISAWATSLIGTFTAQLIFKINGTSVGTSKTLSSKLGEYQSLSVEWNSGSATSITLSIVDQNLNATGNDFALDDIQMFPRLTQGCPKMASVAVTMTTVTVANAGANQNKCNTSAFTMAANAPGAGETGLWTLVSGNGTVTNSASNTSGATVNAGNCANWQWKIQNGSCVSTDAVDLCNDAAVTANAGADLVNCTNNAFTLAANAPTGGATGLWSQVSGTTSIATPTSNTSAATITTTTSTLRWTVTSSHLVCTANDDVLLTNDLLALAASNNGPFCPGSTGQLMATPTNGYTPYTYSWTGPVNFSSTVQNPTLTFITSLIAGTYTANVTDAKGCTKSATTTVVVSSAPTKPGVISF